MKVQQFYAKAIEEGMKADPRGLQRVRQILRDRKKKFDGMTQKEKASFDEESLKNPYGDSRVLHQVRDTEIKRILVGIDLEAPEVILAEMLANKGKKIDLLLAHHPEGHAVAKLFQVMDLQSDILNRFGVPINVAEGIMRDRIREGKHPHRLLTCGAGTRTFHVDAQGRLHPCMLWRYDGYDLLANRLDGAWERRMAELRSTPDETGPCTTCELYGICGRCAPLSRMETGDPAQRIPYHCAVGEARARLLNPDA